MIHLVKLTKKDSSEIAAIHSLAFPSFFLTALGNNVLLVFYTSLIQDKSTIAWGVKDGQTLVGFFVTSTSPNGLYLRIFKKNILSFIIPLSMSFLKNVSLLKRMIISFSSTNSHTVPSIYAASLLSICVSPSYAGKGIGKMLVGKLENELLHQNQQGYYLTTDTDNNEATNHFYLKNNFQLQTVFSQGKRKMNLYVKDLK